MRVTAALTQNNSKQTLVVAAESKPFNVLTGDMTKPFLSCTFSDLLDIRAHFELATRKFSNILIHIDRPLSTSTLENLEHVCTNAATLTLDIPEDFLIRDYRELFSLILPEETLRYACLKGKKVGETEWHSA